MRQDGRVHFKEHVGSVDFRVHIRFRGYATAQTRNKRMHGPFGAR